MTISTDATRSSSASRCCVTVSVVVACRPLHRAGNASAVTTLGGDVSSARGVDQVSGIHGDPSQLSGREKFDRARWQLGSPKKPPASSVGPADRARFGAGEAVAQCVTLRPDPAVVVLVRDSWWQLRSVEAEGAQVDGVW
jgi:hypothetical protein